MKIDRRSWLGLFPFSLVASDSPEPALSEAAVRALLGEVAKLYAQADRCRLTALLRLNNGEGLQPEQRFSFARNGPLLRMERRVVVDSLFVVGRDRTWEYHPHQSEYIERPLSDERSAFIATIIAKHFFTFVGRLPVLAKIDSDVSFLGWKKTRTPGGSRLCAVIGIAAKDTLWIEKLWIDPDTAFVWKSEMSRKAHQVDGKAYRGSLTTTIWTRIEIGEPPDPELFTFKAQKGDRRVEMFGRYEGHD